MFNLIRVYVSFDSASIGIELSETTEKNVVLGKSGICGEKGKTTAGVGRLLA